MDFNPIIEQFAGKYLKPYQGLKRIRICTKLQIYSAGKYLKPYQGLKRDLLFFEFPEVLPAGKYLKPYQGLKPTCMNYPR